jgi:hypothetical protein
MFKENLMSALKRAVDLHNSGSDDNEAVIKSASEYGFNPDQSQRLLETYNTAKTICFYKTAADRTQSFSLADGGVVARELFHNRLPEKKADTLKLHDYSCYDDAIQFEEVGQTWVLDEVKNASGETVKMNEHQVRERIVMIGDLKLAAKKAEDAASMCDMAYGMAVNDIAHEVGVEKVAEALVCFQAGLPSDMAAQVVDDIAARFTGFDKSACAGVGFTMFDVERPALMAKFRDACDNFIKHAQFRAMQAELEHEAEEQDRKLAEATGTAAVAEPGTEFLNESFLKRAADGMKTPADILLNPAGLVGGGVSGAVQDAAKGTTSDALQAGRSRTDKASNKLTLRAKNLHRKFLIEKLITTDPILKGVPHENTIKAYQSLIHLAPEVSLNEEVTRSILRAATQATSLDPYDAKGIVDLDTAIRSQLDQQGGAPIKKKEQQYR